MKSLTNAIIGVTSGVAAFVVLDLLRHHGVEMPSIEWDRATLLAKTAETGSGEAATGDVDDRFAPMAAAIAVDDGGEKAAEGEAPKTLDPVAAAPEADRAFAIDLEGVVVEEISETVESRAAAPVPPRPTAPPVSESTPSDLARAGERAKALAAAMERLGKRLDGTANRRFPR
ncbi:MAG: hypothetical protein ACO38V_02360 [Phycisphaerales bacterium]|jgi:hypothetical protein